MTRSILTLTPNECGELHTIFTTQHGRRIYLALHINAGNECAILDCHYIDRTSTYRPKKLTTLHFPVSALLDMIRAELDKDFVSYEIRKDLCISKEQLLATHRASGKPKILLLLRSGNIIQTCFKNKNRRGIRLTMEIHDGRAVIAACQYCDARSKKSSKEVTPYGLVSIAFPFSLERVLELVNAELEGGFTHILIADEYTVSLDRPICGSI